MFVCAGEHPGEGGVRPGTSHEANGPTYGEPLAVSATAVSRLPDALLASASRAPPPPEPPSLVPFALVLSQRLPVDGHAHVAAFFARQRTAATRRHMQQGLPHAQTAQPSAGGSAPTRLHFTSSSKLFGPSVTLQRRRASRPPLAPQPARNVPAHGFHHVEGTWSVPARQKR